MHFKVVISSWCSISLINTQYLSPFLACFKLKSNFSYIEMAIPGYFLVICLESPFLLIYLKVVSIIGGEMCYHWWWDVCLGWSKKLNSFPNPVLWSMSLYCKIETVDLWNYYWKLYLISCHFVDSVAFS